MYIKHSKKFKKRIKVIQPGEYYVSSEDEMISTLLGSCVAVCLHDPVNGISGMNHFMLPGRKSELDVFEERSAKYGITAINKLINQIQDHGAKKTDLTARIFGGGHVLAHKSEIMRIHTDNVRLAKSLIEMEDIPIIDMDVGSDYSRKLYMDVKSGRIYLKKTNRFNVLQEAVLRNSEIVLHRFAGNEQD